jgi:predicted nucleic acid-binding protein
MEGAPAFGGGVFIADKSVWARSEREPIRDVFSDALANAQIATCALNMIELLYSTRSRAEFEQLEEELSALRYIQTTDSICRAALGALRDLAAHSDGYHRVPPPDLLIAATAQEAAVGVLHYDRDYDRLAQVLAFESRWASPPGSLDGPAPSIPGDGGPSG